MELPRRGSCINLRPRSRDLLRVRSEDLGFDPVKDRQQLQQLKREQYQQHQLQLQEHQRQWRLQQRKLQRQQQRKKQRSEEAAKEQTIRKTTTGVKCQHEKQEAWARRRQPKTTDPGETATDTDSDEFHVIEAPLEAHFLKDTKEKKKGTKEADSYSVTEFSLDERLEDSAQQDAWNEELFDEATWDSLRFSKDPVHRLWCGRCQIYFHYYYHGQNLHTVRPLPPPLFAKDYDRSSPDIDMAGFGAKYPRPFHKILPARFEIHEAVSELIEDSNGKGISEPCGDSIEGSETDTLVEDYTLTADSSLDRRSSRTQSVHFAMGNISMPMDNLSGAREWDSYEGSGTNSHEASDFEAWDEDINDLATPTEEMAPPVVPPRRKAVDMTGKKISETSLTKSNQLDTNSNLARRETAPVTLPLSSNQTIDKFDNRDISDSGFPGDLNQNVFSGSGNNLGIKNVKNKTNANVSNSASTPQTSRALNKVSVRAILPQHDRRQNYDPSITPLGDSPTAVAGVDCDVIGNHIPTEADACGRLNAKTMHGVENTTETRRRNFSSSSLPLSLMSATIEEVDDGEYVGIAPNAHNGQRSHSYGGTATPSPKLPFRALRREARVPSMSSPPRTRRPGTSCLVRSASDNTTTRVGRLRDVDIVGESFESRYPWQRDVGVQCYMDDANVHPHLQRAMSGPAMYTYFRSMSLTSNSPTSSPPHRSRRPALHHHRSCSQSDLLHHPAATTVSDPASAYYYQRHAALSRSNSNSATTNISNSNIINNNNNNCDFSAADNASGGSPYSTRRANFRRRPRPSSMGAVENVRYQHELTKFRELHNSRRDRKSDPQLVLSPGGRRRVALIFPDDTGSVSDLESILENPGDRPWDISRQTSVTSIDFEEDIMRYLEVSENPEAFTETVEDYRLRDDVLPSPPMSPRMWATFDDDDDIDESDDSVNGSDDALQKRLKRSKQPRRLSSGSITSDAESEGTEPDPPVVRRGRRAAIYETKNCGDVSPTTLSPEVSPSNSCDEGEGASNIAERLRRRRSSVDLAMNIYPGDLLVQEHHKKLIKRNTIADFYAGRQPNGGPLPPGVGPGGEGADAGKKGRQPFSLLKLMKTRSKESLTKLDEILKRLKPSEFKDNHLAAYKSLHWSDLIASTDKQQNSQLASISDTERKRREAVWELFKSECVFLIDHLMVLKHCFMEPLKKVQVEGSLMFAEPQDLFGNLDELSYVSYTFCKDFISALLKDMSVTDFGRTKVLLKAFQRFSAHSRDGAVYHSYCLNYTNALAYLEKLRSNSEFGEFEKWCEQDPRCNRLQLTDLLVAPMQHCTKLPLLLHNVRKYTADEDERQQVAESIEKVETSLKQLEEKMRWIKNFERVQEIQRQIVWPTAMESARCVIPECLKLNLSKQPCERLLSCPKRQLLHEGQLILVESQKPIDVHIFLFDDMMLITKVKKIPRKSKQSMSDLQTSGQYDRASYVVLGQPLALDRFILHDISPQDAAVSGLKHCFVLVNISRYQQITGVFTFQAACDLTKSTWLTQIRDAMDAYAKAASSRNSSFKENRDPKSEEKEPARPRERPEFNFVSTPRRVLNGHSNSLRNVPTKSRSMDAVYI